ncbi:MAG: hypothetical protein AB8B79_21575 [Granulosicoccus sp.]
MIKNSLFKLGLAAIVVISVGACSSSSSTPSGGTTGGGTTGGGTTGGGGTDSTGGGAETGVLPVILDRMGRPGVSTALVAANDDKDAYNLSGDPAEWAELFTDALVERATIIDSLDGIEGNSLLNPTTIAGLLVDDRLRIDTSIPECDIYLALEIGLGGCGGRTLERDVIDDTLRHLVSQDNPVDDLATNDSTFQSDWPFLGLAN